MKRPILLWSLLVAVLWTVAISVHVSARAAHVAPGVTVESKPITMGIRN